MKNTLKNSITFKLTSWESLSTSFVRGQKHRKKLNEFLEGHSCKLSQIIHFGKLLKNKFLLFFIILSIIPLIFSCKKEKTPPSVYATSKKITIGFSLDSLIVERWIRDRDIFVSAANELGVDVIFQNAANNPYEQINQVKYLIDKNVDVIVIIPQNADLFVDVVQRARSKGIKVISYDRLIRNANVDLYISVNSIEVGRLMAESIIQTTPSGNYVFIYGPKTDYNVTLVKQGIDSVFVKYPGVFHLLDFYAENWSYDQAYQQVSLLIDEGKRIDAIVCGNDGLAGGAIRALAERRLVGKIPVVGQDSDISACQFVVEGIQLSTVYKPISELAQIAAQYAVSLAKNDYNALPLSRINDGSWDVPVYWLSPIGVNKDNIKEIIVDSGFHTEEEVYRKYKKE